MNERTEASTEKRFCKKIDCRKRLRRDNKSGYCREHTYYTRDPKKHREIARKSYYAHRQEISQRKKERYHLERAANGIVVDPCTAARMGSMRATPRRVLHESWTSILFERMNVLINENTDSKHVRQTWRWAVRLLLARAEKDGLADEREMTPVWLAGIPHQTKDRRKEPRFRDNFARMLLRLQIWSQEDYGLFRQNLEAIRRSKSDTRRLALPTSKPAPAPPYELCQLAQELAYRCGLSTAGMRKLRVSHIEPDGLRIPPRSKSEKREQLVPELGRFIPFGDGWGELPKTILDAYLRAEKPTDYLFFSRSPRDKRSPISKIALNGAVIRSGSTIKALCKRHFDQDFQGATSLQEARFHLRNVHGLDDQYVHHMIAGSQWWTGYAKEAATIPIPEPYLVAAICASRLAPHGGTHSTTPQGGERHLVTWADLLGYEITVDWKRSFAEELIGDRQKGAKVFRLLCRLAFDFWFMGRRTRLYDTADSEIRRLGNKDLLQTLAVTKVMVRCSHASWASGLFEYGSRKRSFRIPLIEEMHRLGWHNRCMICWHPERDKIEQEISDAANKESRRKGYDLIARKYGVTCASLAGHGGRRPRRGRFGETQRSHFSTGSKAPILRCPRRFFEQLPTLSATDSMIYSLLLIELHHRRDLAGLIISTELINQRLNHLCVDQSQLSVALNHLGSTGAGLIRFKREPNGFYVEFLR